MKGALRPESHEDVRSIWQREREKTAKTKGIEEEDAAILNLYETKGWQVLKAHIENLKVGLDQRLAESVLKSLGDQQIKTDALFSVLGKELLNSIISKVEDTALIVEQIENEQEQGRS